MVGLKIEPPVSGRPPWFTTSAGRKRTLLNHVNTICMAQSTRLRWCPSAHRGRPQCTHFR